MILSRDFAGLQPIFNRFVDKHKFPIFPLCNLMVQSCFFLKINSLLNT